MPVIAKLRYLRIAPRKVRLVADLIRKKRVEQAQTILNFTIKKASQPLLKLLKTAIADAKNNFQIDPSNLYISKITVDEGPKYKRWRPRSRGMVHQVQKKTSHITLILEEVTPGKKIKKVKKVKQEPKEEIIKKEKPKFEPPKEKEVPKPKRPRGLKRFFRRKAF